MKQESYSTWNKVDLHIHTAKSKETKIDDYQGSFSVEKLKEKLIENDVSIFSLTDHNIFNIEAYKEYYAEYDEMSDPLLLPGVELDVKVIQEEREKRYHTLLIFRESTVDNIIELNRKLELAYSKAKITDPFKRILTIKEIVDTFYGADFFFIPHANYNGKKTSIKKAYGDEFKDAQLMLILMPSALEKVKEEHEHRYNYGFNSISTPEFKQRNDIAYITFSDNHNIDRYPCIHKGKGGEHSFYYLKGLKNFETLRLAFIDPKSRIVSSDEYKSINHSLNYIEKLSIQNDEILKSNELSFSPHMNVIIGGRSSGKSLFLNLLGRKIDKINVEDKYKIETEHVNIKSKRDSDFQVTTSISDDLIFLNQGDIVRYFEEKKLSKLAEDSNKQDEYVTTLTNFKDHKRKLEDKIDTFIASYKIAFETSESKRFVLHDSTIESLLNENFILNLDEDKLLEEFNVFEQINETKVIIEGLTEKLLEFKTNKILQFSEEEQNIINDFEKLIKDKSLYLEEKEKGNTKVTEFIRDVKKIIDDNNQGLSTEARNKENAVRVLDQLKGDFFVEFDNLIQLKQKCIELESFTYAKKEKIVLNEDVSLVLEIEKKEELRNMILEGLKGSNYKVSFFLNILSLINKSSSIKNHPDNNSISLDKKIKKVLEDLYKNIELPKDHLEYSNGNSSKDNSPGYNSEKYLEIILKNPDTKMILIDQPEDNLGNKFISDDLVKIFRELKFQKQLFIVTHNPSIVVYGDAENIIIAENNDNVIHYKQIVLENQEAQKEICDILDGGEYIFDNRSKKYNIKRILIEDRKNG
jgi:PHP domain